MRSRNAQVFVVALDDAVQSEVPEEYGTNTPVA